MLELQSNSAGGKCTKGAQQARAHPTLVQQTWVMSRSPLSASATDGLGTGDTDREGVGTAAGAADAATPGAGNVLMTGVGAGVDSGLCIPTAALTNTQTNAQYT